MIFQVEKFQRQEWQRLGEIETIYFRLQEYLVDQRPPITEINHEQIFDEGTTITYHPDKGKYAVTDNQSGTFF